VSVDSWPVKSTSRIEIGLSGCMPSRVIVQDASLPCPVLSPARCPSALHPARTRHTRQRAEQAGSRIAKKQRRLFVNGTGVNVIRRPDLQRPDA
jgi:hypothetical protein